ncbi:MAG: S41 family peptidase [Candidatus Omnitrophica bacterium]|nr:S41 family peptidase [Candidatus Omnitrophota bacterium]
MFKKAWLIVFLLIGVVSFATYARSQAEKTPSVPKALSEAEALPAEVNSVEEKKDEDTGPQDLYSQVELFSYVLTTVQSEYVVEKKPKDLIYGALTGMVGALDPHSQFLPPDDYKDLKTETEGKFGGLGIEITTRDGLLTIVTPIEDTPAWRAGLKAGDRIVKIEKKITRDMTLSEAVKQLRGKPGTKVHITILRESEFKVHEYDIVREVIHVQDVKEPAILEDKIAYVRLVEFREDSYEQIYASLKKLKDQGATSLIFDVRNNPGGLLNVAIKISEMFLPEGLTIVSTKGRHSAQDSISMSKNTKHEFTDWPIVVLINEGSASGSEILAGALKDNKRAVILGAKSFGKGSVQSVIPLPDGSGLRLTTSKYFTPSGVCIHDIGIMPDIVVERVYPKGAAENDDGDEIKDTARNGKDLKKASKDVFDKLEDENISDPNEKEKRRKELEFKKKMAEDNQVQSAISVIKGIRVYKKLVGE